MDKQPIPPMEPWEFAGWGKAFRIENLPPTQPGPQRPATEKLGEWRATALCGNDITSSCLYVSALCAAQAGVLAPLVLLVVAVVLYLFRSVYAEVGSALPLNGGTYTVLLNTTNKRLAASAACLTLLSYIATAVISASEAMHYAHHLLGALPVFEATIGLLAFFALLNVMGIGESSRVALGIFVLHLTTMALLIGCSLWSVLQAPELLAANWHLPPAGGVLRALVLGFAAAMLGVSGFESSANFIEEQKSGVFPKTLRNMWLAVAVLNPLLSFLSLGLLPLAQIQQVPPDLLAQMGRLSGGEWLSVLVSLDATLVLSGAVLTSYVGVCGLIRRMALDRCLPQVLLEENRWRGTNHWIILAFFFLCWSILTITGGQIGVLAGVYALSFLAVMALFAVGNMLLKVKRARLPRKTHASWPQVGLALVAVLVALAGNILLDPTSVRIFAEYYMAVGALVVLMFIRLPLLRGVLFISRSVVERVQAIGEALRASIVAHVEKIGRRPVIFFTKGDDLANLNRAALYVRQNEQTRWLKVVHLYREATEIPPQLAEHLATIDQMYPELRVDFVAVRGEFTPDTIERLSRLLRVPRNYMFIGTPGDRFPHEIETLGGVRLIL